VPLFAVSIKQPKRPSTRKHYISQYAVVADDAEAAKAKARQKHGAHRPIEDISATFEGDGVRFIGGYNKA